MSAAQKLKQRLFSAPSDAKDDAGSPSLKIDIPGQQQQPRPGTPSQRPALRRKSDVDGTGLPSSGNSVSSIPVPPGYKDPSSSDEEKVNTDPEEAAPRATESYRQRLLNKLGTQYASVEEHRLDQDRLKEKHWKRWGPYLSERQWATVREDYSANGDAWTHFPHEHARSRAYRWGEDGIAGVSDNHGRLNWALGLWNEEDDILKERLFGVTGHQGNHGEDVKELYYYLDSTVRVLFPSLSSFGQGPLTSFGAFRFRSRPTRI